MAWMMPLSAPMSAWATRAPPLIAMTWKRGWISTLRPSSVLGEQVHPRSLKRDESL